MPPKEIKTLQVKRTEELCNTFWAFFVAYFLYNSFKFLGGNERLLPFFYSMEILKGDVGKMEQIVVRVNEVLWGSLLIFY